MEKITALRSLPTPVLSALCRQAEKILTRALQRVNDNWGDWDKRRDYLSQFEGVLDCLHTQGFVSDLQKKRWEARLADVELSWSHHR